jgi:hypothetical protein
MALEAFLQNKTDAMWGMPTRSHSDEEHDRPVV